MRYIKFKAILFILLMTTLGACLKDDAVTLKESYVEFDAAVANANAAGVTYPILTRVPRYGQALVTTGTTADPSITRAIGAIKFRINLVGAQRSTPTEVSYIVVPTVSTAVAGTHYTALPGKVTIPANSSYGEIEITILNPGVGTGTRDLVLELTGGSDLPPSENEKRIAIRISQI